ncbi:MAG TPA: S8 family serine peptidase, partial [Pyrinomonadaceae bacterium]
MLNNRTLTRLAALLLLFSLSTGSVVKAAAAPADDDSNRGEDGERRARADKVSPALRVRLRKGSAGDGRVRVILQFKDEEGDGLRAFLNREGVHVHGSFKHFRSKAVELPLSAVDELSNFEEVLSVSPDGEVKTLGHVTTTTGADAVRKQTTTTFFGTTTTTLDGSGVGIAVLDSGIDPNHVAFQNASGASRIAYSQDFTGEGRTDDPFGHGTYVASAAAGNGRVSSGAFTGIAPNAKIVNLRVLNSQGIGTTSGLLSALNWVMTYGAYYNVRVVNMSLGTPALDSYKLSPLCSAVRRMVNAGIVVVAAAGNIGKNPLNGNKIYGAIHAPGNEPSAVTVGSANTFGTDARDDDAVASYSSKGPTRSFWTDILGVRHYDNLVKPDLVAPGNRLIYAEGSNNRIVTNHPEMDSGVSTEVTSRMMYMSGTSVAAPVVAGAAALVLQANPKLTPNMVKMALTYTAQPLPGFNTFEQGAGEVNIEGAVRLAKAIRTDLTSNTALGAQMLTTTAPPAPQTT